jgi:hypothetical protein
LGEELDQGLLLHLTHEALYELPEPETTGWLLQAIAVNPGIHTAHLCRAMHGQEETYRDIAYCGRCSEYSNPAKRRRAARLQKNLLPGFEQIGGAFQLHPPCSRRGLTWLRHRLYRLVAQGRLIKRREKRPDLHQPRGWDMMSVYYIKEERPGL